MPLAATAASFATSPAGYVTGIGLPLLFAYVIYRFERTERHQQRHADVLEGRFRRIEDAQKASSEALSTQAQALQVMIAEFSPIKMRVGGLEEATVTLRESVSGLRSVVGMHLRMNGQSDVIPGDRSPV